MLLIGQAALATSVIWLELLIVLRVEDILAALLQVNLTVSEHGWAHEGIGKGTVGNGLLVAVLFQVRLRKFPIAHWLSLLWYAGANFIGVSGRRLDIRATAELIVLVILFAAIT